MTWRKRDKNHNDLAQKKKGKILVVKESGRTARKLTWRGRGEKKCN